MGQVLAHAANVAAEVNAAQGNAAYAAYAVDAAA